MSIPKAALLWMLMLALWAPASGSLGARSPERRLYERLVRARFPSKKLALALGRLRSPQAKALLSKLLDKGMFHRELAYYGLLALEDQEAARKLARRLLSSGISDATLERAFVVSGSVAQEALCWAYRKAHKARDQVKLLRLLGRSQHPTAQAFLQKLAEKTSLPQGLVALEELVKHHARASRVFLNRLARDGTLGQRARRILALRDPRIARGVVAVERARFHDKMIAAGRALGRLRSDAARDGLLLLLSRDRAWTREAAVTGLAEMLKRPEVFQTLLEVRFHDPMVASTIDALVRKRVATAFDSTLALATRPGLSGKRRAWLLDMIRGASPPPRARVLKRALTRVKGSPLKAALLGAFVRLAGPRARRFVLSFATDPASLSSVVIYLARHGKAADLPLFDKILVAPAWRGAGAVAAMVGIARFASRQRQRAVYARALAQKDRAIKVSAMRLFAKRRSPKILGRLVALARNAHRQDLRLMAGDQIARYRDKAAVPALIRLLGERFESSRLAQAVDTAFFFMMPPVALAAGVAGHRLSGQKQLRRQHARRLRRYAAALTRITGAKLGLSQAAWQRWAKAHP